MASTPAATAPLTASCHCGRVTFAIPAPPTKCNECRCSICYAYGVFWAYYTRRDVTVTTAGTGAEIKAGENADLSEYKRTDAAAAGSEAFYRCANCGCMTHWWGLGANASDDAKMGVNARLLGENAIEGVESYIGRC
ncbi:Uu.00g090150.m01.CDS01 [Anthostomella pinea]|uniref:Uu.00g090150.m01.CDS01 n=1 Tax=Anthostomella pinea TaxID=933095 RepID=A0AAI8YHU9_9PEZI|nr:Uu.00g090150.m01.CDS01 [Anthostomella pinea]